jgi:hypothetical protein
MAAWSDEMNTPARKPPPPPQYFDARRMMLWSAILVALVGSLGYAAYTSGPSTFGGFDVAMKVTAEPSVVPLSGDRAGRVILNVDVQNRTGGIQRLNAPAACKLFRWTLTSEEGALVQTHNEDCERATMELKLQPDERKTETFEAQLDPKRLEPGQRYQFNLEYWGLRGILVIRAADE